MDKIAFTMAEAAELIGATEKQLEALVTARRIRHSRLGGENGRGVRFTKDQLLDFLARNQVEAQQ